MLLKKTKKHIEKKNLCFKTLPWKNFSHLFKSENDFKETPPERKQVRSPTRIRMAAKCIIISAPFKKPDAYTGLTVMKSPIIAIMIIITAH